MAFFSGFQQLWDPMQKIFHKIWIRIAWVPIGSQWRTANISTAKSTGFTWVPFSPVLSLSFRQSTNAGSESLYFKCTPKSFPNFTTFTCYFDIFVEKKITANHLSKIYSLMTQDSNLPTNILNIILSSALDHLATLNSYLYCKFLLIKSFWFHDQFFTAPMTFFKL